MYIYIFMYWLWEFLYVYACIHGHGHASNLYMLELIKQVLNSVQWCIVHVIHSSVGQSGASVGCYFLWCKCSLSAQP